MEECRTNSGEIVDGTSRVSLGDSGGQGDEGEEGERERLDAELMATSRSFGEWELEEDPQAGHREADTAQSDRSPEWIWGGDYNYEGSGSREGGDGEEGGEMDTIDEVLASIQVRSLFASRQPQPYELSLNYELSSNYDLSFEGNFVTMPG